MKFLKGLSLSLLSLLLFLSLSVFGIVLTINQTILNPDFAASQIDKLDISSIAEEFISDQFAGQIPTQEQALVTEVLEDTIADIEPWIKEQANTVIYATYDYLLGKSQSLNVEISTKPIKDSLEKTLESAFMESLPSSLAGAPPAMIDAAFEEYYQQLETQLPATIIINESMLGTDFTSGIEQARQYIGYVQTAYNALIAIILVLIALIILINRQVRGSTRQIGITFLTYGIPGYASIFILKNYAMTQLTQMTQFNLPVSLQAWLPQLVDGILAPLEMFSLGILIGGVVLLVISFVYKPVQTQ